MRKSISTTYFTATTTLLLASVVLLGAMQMYLMSAYFTSERRTSLSGLVEITSEYALDALENPAEAERLPEETALIARTGEATVLLLNADGTLWMCSDNSMQKNVRVPEALLQKMQLGDAFFEQGNLGGAYPARYYTAGRALYSEGSLRGYVLVSTSAKRLTAFLGDIFSGLVLSAGIMMLIASVISIVFTNRLTEPLRRITAAARGFGSGDLTVRVQDVTGDDEVAQLASTFNQMAQNIEASDTSRADFMGNIAHELRTPMTTIKGFIDGMLDGTIPPEMQQHYLTLVSQEVGRLARLTQNMLDITKLEAGEYKVNARSYDIWESVTGVALSAEKRIEEKQIEVQGLAPTRTMVYADPDLVYQVLYNLLDNALKFTPQGGILRFGVQKLGDMVTVSLYNSGEGISPEALPFVFERFYKEDKSRGLNKKGSGLGLHICKVLVNLSGGEIRVESQEGEWCRFSFTLPTENKADPAKHRLGLGRAGA